MKLDIYRYLDIYDTSKLLTSHQVLGYHRYLVLSSGPRMILPH